MIDSENGRHGEWREPRALYARHGSTTAIASWTVRDADRAEQLTRARARNALRAQILGRPFPD